MGRPANSANDGRELPGAHLCTLHVIHTQLATCLSLLVEPLVDTIVPFVWGFSSLPFLRRSAFLCWLFPLAIGWAVSCFPFDWSLAINAFGVIFTGWVADCLWVTGYFSLLFLGGGAWFRRTTVSFPRAVGLLLGDKSSRASQWRGRPGSVQCKHSVK